MPDTGNNIREPSTKLEIVLSSPKDVARYFCYVEKLSKIEFSDKKESKPIVLYKNISAKLIYSENKKIFDRLFQSFSKNNLDIKKFIDFFILELGKTRWDIQDLLSINTLNRYVLHNELIWQYRKICSYLEKSIKNVVDNCLEMGYSDCRGYLAYLAKSNKLGEKYISGEISQYYLASIANMDKLIGKMDNLNREELNLFLERKEKLNSDAQTAYMKIRHEHFNPISMTNIEIGLTKNKQQERKIMNRMTDTMTDINIEHNNNTNERSVR